MQQQMGPQLSATTHTQLHHFIDGTCLQAQALKHMPAKHRMLPVAVMDLTCAYGSVDWELLCCNEDS